MEQNNSNPNPYYNNPDSTPEDNNNNTVYYNRPGRSSGQGHSSYSGRHTEPPNNFARLSMIIGGIALISVFTFTIIPDIILGSLSLILALLSRGKELTFHPSAKSAAILASVALACNVALVGGSVYMVFGDNTLHDQINATYEEMFGMTYDEILEGVMDGSVDIDDLYEKMYENMY